MQDIHRLFYVSSASDRYDEKAIQYILQSSRRNNRRLDITGCLLFSGRHFAQVLEGPHDVVSALAARVATDSRHTTFRVLWDAHVDARRYDDWSMGFMQDMAMEDELEQMQTTDQIDPARVQRMLQRLRPDGTPAFHERD